MTEKHTGKGEQAKAAGAEANGRAKADGLSRRQIRALEALAAAGGPLYRKELAKGRGSTRPASATPSAAAMTPLTPGRSTP